MKIEISFPNKKLKKELEQALKDLEYWRKLHYDNCKKNQRWCDDIHDRINAMLAPTSGFGCLDTALMALLEEYKKLGGKAIDTKYCLPVCPNKECRTPLSHYWDYCPRCGSKLIKEK